MSPQYISAALRQRVAAASRFRCGYCLTAQRIDDGTLIRGKTPVGRATVIALQMNHPDMIEARRLWVMAGWHPPQD